MEFVGNKGIVYTLFSNKISLQKNKDKFILVCIQLNACFLPHPARLFITKGYLNISVST